MSSPLTGPSTSPSTTVCGLSKRGTPHSVWPLWVAAQRLPWPVCAFGLTRRSQKLQPLQESAGTYLPTYSFNLHPR